MNLNPQNFVLGIDLGTTNSLIAITSDKIDEVLENTNGKRLTPSCVYFDPTSEKIQVGTLAVQRKASNLTNTIYDIKRLMGMSYNDAEVVQFRKNVPFKISNFHQKLHIEVTHNGKTCSFRPQEISAQILKTIKRGAEERLEASTDSGRVQIKSVVVTVPAYFKNKQKEATIEAAKIAGFNEIRLLTEPTAVALGYAYKENHFKNCRSLVIDFGGGTFDVAIVQIQDGHYETVQINGDPHLGGRDIDIALREHFADRIKELYKRNCHDDKQISQILLDLCEELKKSLSTEKKESESIYIGNLFADVKEELVISQATFREICSHFFTKAISLIKRALMDAKINPEEIDEVLMAGGTTRIKHLQRMIESELKFGENKFNRSLSCNTDKVVAIGAAVYAAKIASQLETGIPISISEVTPLTLGVSTLYNMYEPMIPSNSHIPCRMKKSFTIAYNHQRSVSYKIFEGERKDASKNRYIGMIEYHGLRDGVVDEVWITLIFKLDINGILAVSLEYEGKEKRMKFNYDIRSPRHPDVQRARFEAELNCNSDTADEKCLLAKQAFNTEIEKTKAKYKSPAMLKLCRAYERWMKGNPDTTKRNYRIKLEMFRREIQKLDPQ